MNNVFMHKTMLAIIAVFILTLGIVLLVKYQSSNNNNQTSHSSMNITSSVFNNNESIPEKYTCDGDNVNPQLTFNEVPTEAKSLVLIMDDPDIPDFVKTNMGIEIFNHWLIFNMPAETKELLENSKPLGLQGNNSAGDAQYTGPCPPDKEHRYFFKLYALDTMLDLPEGSDKIQIETAMHNHVIEEAQLIGLYLKK